jgi:predicted transcriptional regulator
MATTSLKLPSELKQRAVTAAQQQDMSPHAFMVAAIAQAVSAAEQRATLIAAAKSARRETLEDGEGFAADAVHAYFSARASGKDAAKPEPCSWRT